MKRLAYSNGCDSDSKMIDIRPQTSGHPEKDQRFQTDKSLEVSSADDAVVSRETGTFRTSKKSFEKGK